MMIPTFEWGTRSRDQRPSNEGLHHPPGCLQVWGRGEGSRRFGRPGNRFWPALHAGGFTPRLLTPFEESDLLTLKLGITNVVPRATATAEELSLDEFSAGGRILDKKIRKFRPRTMAVLGIGAYRAAFGKPKAALGLQEDSIGDTAIWVLPNPSGLNAHFSAADFGSLFAELRRWIQGH